MSELPNNVKYVAGPSVQLVKGLQHLRDRASQGERYVYRLTSEQAAALLAERDDLMARVRRYDPGYPHGRDCQCALCTKAHDL
jgi:hypothetical protein